MNRHIFNSLVVTALIGGSVTAFAEQEIQVRGTVDKPKGAVAQATAACLEAFAAKVVPASAHARFLIPKDHERVSTFTPNRMAFQMSMTSTSSRKELATGSCEANGRGKVQYLTARVPEPARLAALDPKTLRVAFNSR